MVKTLHFKSKEAYRKFNAYRFVHKVNKGEKLNVMIHGKKHKVKHEG